MREECTACHDPHGSNHERLLVAKQPYLCGALLDYAAGGDLTVGFGYAYEKYDFSDAFSAGTEVYPLAGAFYLKANDGAYEVNVVYARLNYRF